MTINNELERVKHDFIMVHKGHRKEVKDVS